MISYSKKCENNIKEYLLYLYDKSTGINGTYRFNNFLKLLLNNYYKISSLFDLYEPWTSIIHIGVEFYDNKMLNQVKYITYSFIVYINKKQCDFCVARDIYVKGLFDNEAFKGEYFRDTDKQIIIDNFKLKGDLETLEIQIDNLGDTYYNIPNLLTDLSIDFYENVIRFQIFKYIFKK